MKRYKYIFECIQMAIIILVVVCSLTLVFNYKAYRVYGDSMETTLSAGELVLIHECKIDEASIGDIIAYNGPDGHVVIHRVVETTVDISGNKYLYTKGDNNDKIDTLAVSKEMVIGKYSRSIKLFDKVISFIEQ